MILYVRLLAEPSAITTTSAAVSAVRLGVNVDGASPLPPMLLTLWCFGWRGGGRSSPPLAGHRLPY